MTTSLLPRDELRFQSGESWFQFRDVIDAAGIRRLRQALAGFMVAPRVFRLDCHEVRSIEPVGAALLWQLCHELDQTIGTRLRLVGVNQLLAQKLRTHPLLGYFAIGEEIFADPFESPEHSRR